MSDPTYQPKIYGKDGGDTLVVATGGVVNFEASTGLQVNGSDKTAALAALPPDSNYATGVAAGYKVARGVHLQVAAQDTVVTGLTTVVAIVVSPIAAPTAKQSFVSATIGNQAGAPAAGSVLINTWKSTFAAADDFTDNLSFAWVAIGT